MQRLAIVVAALTLTHASVRAETPPKSRTFDLTYTATIPTQPGGGTLRVWLPVPSTGWDQEVGEPVVHATVPTKLTVENQYGNRILFAQTAPQAAPVVLSWTCRVTRREHRGGGAGVSPTELRSLKRFLADDSKAPVHHPRVAAALHNAVGARPDRTETPRAVYEYVVSHMKYDKVAPGWGQGDTLRACDVGKGNCTDFHSLFTSMVRRAEIPAKFVIGFSIPPAHGAGTIAGYHCWAYYLSREKGWIPVDASEAFKHPELRDYYFGDLTADRVELSEGRDITLAPAQAGPPLNYFLNPYAEQGGHPVPGLKSVTTYRDFDSAH